jgi:hypothetical protein
LSENLADFLACFIPKKSLPIYLIKFLQSFRQKPSSIGHAGVKNHLPPEQTDHLPPVKMVNPRRSKLTTP